MGEADSQNALPVGSEIGDYKIVRVLGQGGLGIVYEGLNPDTRQQAAIKEFFPSGLVDRGGQGQMVPGEGDANILAWARERFAASTRDLRALDHPNILRVLDHWQANGTGYMAMEYLKGQTLADWLEARSTPPTLDELRPILDPVLDGLAYVHRQGLIHRSLSPADIFMTDQGRPVLIDFGDLARAEVEEIGVQVEGYTAPDQIRGNAKPNPTTDVYAVGAVLYRALTGAPPVDAVARSKAMKDGGADPYQPLSQRSMAGISPEAARAIDACLAMRKSDRPQSMGEVRTMLGWAS